MSTSNTTTSTLDDLATAIDRTVAHIRAMRNERTTSAMLASVSNDQHPEELLTEHLHKLLDEHARRFAPEPRPMEVAYGESTMQRISDALTEIDIIRKEVRGVRSISALNKAVANPSINRIEADAIANALDTTEIRLAAVWRLFP